MPKHTQHRRDVLRTVAISALTSAMMSAAIPTGLHLLSDTGPLPLSGSPSQLNVSGSNDGGGTENQTLSGENTRNGGTDGVFNAVNPDGSGNGSNDCVMAQIHCSLTDSACTTPPTFAHIACNDAQCLSSRDLCVPAPLINTLQTGTNGITSGKSGDTNVSGDHTDGATGGTNGNGESGSNGLLNMTGQNGQSDNGSQGGPSVPTIGAGTTGDTKTLGCFKTDGTWTTDRTACDPDQAKHFQTTNSDNGQTSISEQQSGNNAGNPNTNAVTPAHTSIEQDQQDQQLQLQLDSQFHSSGQRDSAYANLVNAATTALNHIDTLSQQTLPVEAATTVTAAQQWIQQLLSMLSTGEPTIEQVEQQAQELRDKLSEVQSVLANSIQVTPPKPQQIIDPLNSLLSSIPNVFQFLQSQGIVLTQDPLTEYQTAASLYLQYKPQCLQNSDACLQMGDVITHLESMRTDLEQILQQAGRTDLEPQIDQMLQ